MTEYICHHCHGAGCDECRGAGGGVMEEEWLSRREALERGLPIPREAFAFVIQVFEDREEWWAVSVDGWTLVRVVDRLPSK